MNFSSVHSETEKEQSIAETPLWNITEDPLSSNINSVSVASETEKESPVTEALQDIDINADFIEDELERQAIYANNVETDTFTPSPSITTLNIPMHAEVNSCSFN